MQQMLEIDNVTQLNTLLNQPKPKHPLVSIVDFSKMDFAHADLPKNTKITTHFYSILLKELQVGSLSYGRNYYDFQEGSLFFMAPNQVFSLEQTEDIYGWGVYFHPDLIRATSLYSKILQYSFFHYDTHEALHLSDDEKQTLTQTVQGIIDELQRPIDRHTQAVIVSGIELLLNHCLRFYDRQFITRNEANRDIVARIESFLIDYYRADSPKLMGLPTVVECAKAVNLSTNYLSDLLKKETGKSTQDHIHYFLIEQAKTKLQNTSLSINEIAYELGFEYPQYFGKLFKKKVGITPVAYRSTR